MKMRQCETDLVVISKNHEGRTQLVIGESKSKMQVSEDDVENLRHVADAFPEERVEPYILFSKLSSFTPEEIELCRTAQGRYRYRVIMLSDRELEPYFIYERTAEEVDLGQDRHAVCLEDLAKVTDRIYSVPLLG
jgi:hypothetical protein